MSLKPEFSLLEENEIPKLEAAIASIMAENDAPNKDIFNHNYWNWEYRSNPDVRTYCNVVRSEGEILGYCHVLVFRGTVRGEEKRIGTAMDGAVINKLRGRGVFRSLAGFIDRDLEQGDVDCAYIFPNRKSIHTYLKYNGYRQISTLRNYLLPLDPAGIIASRVRLFGLEHLVALPFHLARSVRSTVSKAFRFELERGFTEEQAELFRDFYMKRDVALVKVRKYLNWRFTAKPGCIHYTASARGNDGTEAVAIFIFKEDTILGCKALILMDFTYSEGGEKAFVALMRKAASGKGKWFGGSFQLLFTAGTGNGFSLLPQAGFIHLPLRLVPRPLDLLVRNFRLREPVVIFEPAGWQVTLSDWDVL